MTTSKEALAKVKGRAVSLTKKTVTGPALFSSGVLSDRLKSKMQDKLSSTAKSASSANQISNALSLTGQVDQFKGAAGKIAELIPSQGTTPANAAKLKGKLGSMVQQSIGGLVGESQINEKLAATLVTTGPQDDLLVVDAYDFTPKEILSKFTGKLSSLGKDSFDSLRGGGGLARTVAGMLKATTSGGLKLDTKELKSRLTGLVGGRAGLTNSLLGSFGETLSEVAGTDPNLLRDTYVVIDGLGKRVKSDDFLSTRTLFDAIGAVVENENFATVVDSSGRAALLAGIYRESIRQGVPEAIDLIIEKANESDRSAVVALSYVVTDAVFSGNLKAVNTAIDKLGRDNILARHPTAVQIVLSSYSFPAEMRVEERAQEFVNLDTTLRRLDPHWGTYRRGATYVPDLSAYTHLSADARTLLLYHGDRQGPVSIASHYTHAPLLALARSMYPQVAFE